MKIVVIVIGIIVICLVLGFIALWLLPAVQLAGPGRDPLANEPQAPAEPEREAESSSGLCGLALAPPLLLLLAAGFAARRQPEF